MIEPPSRFELETYGLRNRSAKLRFHSVIRRLAVLQDRGVRMMSRSVDTDAL